MASTPKGTPARQVVGVSYVSRPRLTEAKLRDQIASADAALATESDPSARGRLERKRRGWRQQLAYRLLERWKWRPVHLSQWDMDLEDWVSFVELDYDSPSAWRRVVPKLADSVLEEFNLQLSYVLGHPEEFSEAGAPARTVSTDTLPQQDGVLTDTTNNEPRSADERRRLRAEAKVHEVMELIKDNPFMSAEAIADSMDPPTTVKTINGWFDLLEIPRPWRRHPRPSSR